LTAELQQREQLIEVLTERLEEAAEQLDRMHRSGADRAVRAGGGGGGGGLPGEFVDRLFGMADGLELMTAEWQDVQAAALLNRIDARIDRLIDVLRGDASGGYDSPDTASAPSSYGGVEPAATPGSPSAPPLEPAVAAPTPPVEEEPPLELVNPPAEIPDTETNPEVLRNGLRAREEYIVYLIRELQRRRPRQPIDWNALQACPEDLTREIKALETRLQSELQREELNLSLERAKMARERAELDKIRSRLEKEIRSLGRGAAPEPAAADEASGSPGLFKMFGRKR
jgi:hypothetical protein